MPHAPDLSGHVLNDRYELRAILGEGAFGRVYSGWDRRLEREVAVKVIKPWWAEDPEWAESFEREARLLARISHPGIVQIFDVGQAPDGLYYVSELVDGENLASRLARGPLSPWDAAALAEQLCRALAQAHAKSIIHRDVKPANILISKDGRIKVGDFGVARLAEGSSDGASATIVGTPRYMSPEQARGLGLSPATDVYSVGVVLYEMLAGQPPFTERSAVELALRHLHDQPPELPARTPAEIVEITGRALAKDAAERYADAGEMAQALQRARLGVSANRAGAPRRARSRAGVLVGAAATAKPGSSGSAGPSNSAGPSSSAGRSGSAGSAGNGSGSGGGGPRSRSRRPAPPPAGDRQQPTRRAPKYSTRRNQNPAARRRSIAALTFAFLVLGAMIAAAVVLGATAHVRVPHLTGLTRSRAQANANRLALQTSFGSRYSDARKGTVIAQSPRARTRVREHSTIHVWLSAGPPPVPVPQLAGEQLTDATARLAQIGLAAKTNVIPAPGVPAGEVTSQSPAPGARLAPPHRVILNVAEQPQWRALTSVSGGGHSTNTEFKIRGVQWRLVYNMAYQGTCTFIFWCSGPQAQVENVATGATVGSFGLNDGGRQARVFSGGPGVYRLTISPGADSAQWQAWVEDYY